MSKKVVIFDFDGVIVDTFDFCLNISQIKDPNLTAAEYREYFKGNIYNTKAAEEKEVSDFDFFAFYTVQIMMKDPIQGMADAIAALSDKYTLVIVSSTDSGPISKFLEKHDLFKYFKDIFGGDVERSKIKKIEMVLDKYKVSAKDCVFITDTLGDIKEARKVGVESIAVPWGYHDTGTLKEGTPHAFAKTPSDLIPKITNYLS